MIKVFIIAAMSADGLIARNSEHAAMWTSKADRKRFAELTKKAGVVVMGANTYKTMGKPLKDTLNIVYSKSQTFENAETTQDSPIELIKKLEEKGFKEVAICGGSHIYSMFLRAGLVDTIYITIEPLVFGKGVSIFNEELHYFLKLKSAVASESSGAILLEYKVDYSGTTKLKD